jgi:uncharacterized damage-inducible protein DinB
VGCKEERAADEPFYTFRMALKDALLPEYDHEMGTTRRLLERVPDADLGWKPHEKSFSLGRLASHLANIPHWIDLTCAGPVLDLATLPEDAREKDPKAIADVLKAFDANVKRGRQTLEAQTDAMMMAQWTMKQGEQEILTMPRIAVLRSFILNHLIHHRGQMSVYLRLRNVPVPAIYGPSADEG